MDIKSIKWEKTYSLHIKEIDRQHKHYIEILNELNQSLYAKERKEKVEEIFQKLIDYGIIHFATEEKYFDKFHYKQKDEHIKEHENFKKKILELKKKLHNNELKTSFDLIDFLEDWLVDHLMTMDKKYVECFHKHGLY